MSTNHLPLDHWLNNGIADAVNTASMVAIIMRILRVTDAAERALRAMDATELLAVNARTCLIHWDVMLAHRAWKGAVQVLSMANRAVLRE